MVAMNVWPTDAADGSVSNEARWRKMGRHWTYTGVLGRVGNEMAPSLAYPNLTVKDGAAWVDGVFCELLGTQVLAVTPNGLAVVRLDPAANTAQLLYLDGVSVPSQSPTGVFELPIAKIVGSAMTDLRVLSGALPGPTTINYDSGQVGAPSAAGATTIAQINVGIATFRHHLSMTGYLLIGGQAAGSATVDMIRGIDGVSVNGQNNSVGGNLYSAFPMVSMWDVQVGQSAQFSLRVTPSTNMWAIARFLYTITPF